MINFFIIGAILGLSAGFAPGPLLALVVSETLQHNIRAGIKVALAPILTDLPIILFSLLILAKLSNFHAVLGVISLGGGLFLLLLGYQSLKAQGVVLDVQEVSPKSLSKGILTNFLSPHPYLFWLSVGAPTMTSAMNSHSFSGVSFIGGFYFCLVGAKITVAILTGKSRSFLTGNSYRAIIRCLGLLLIILAGKLFYDGLTLLQVMP
ncbi:MAG: LysE family transporter [Thermodesulfobacteriota bacterium]|nr:LysE family transporter [Thermodesulfobacteriota bacterium]